ncbi:MAG TPA: type II toxin-antitoxin system HicB family antitoxin [Fimbriimonadaceae bacterium]|nr:type II toxin-antitoxin system HicB family antitoxin [Fimbriimonadaceae bacterium]
MRFQAIFVYDDEYQGYTVEVPELPGCMSQGKTLDEAVANVREAIQGVLFVLEKNGEPYKPATRAVLVGEIAV